jgi:hypothetical protein
MKLDAVIRKSDGIFHFRRRRCVRHVKMQSFPLSVFP